jgi:hypothetical protein
MHPDKKTRAGFLEQKKRPAAPDDAAGPKNFSSAKAAESETAERETHPRQKAARVGHPELID